jgi:hypothetical protein
MLKNKIWANVHRIIELFTKKTVTKLSKIWGWDPGSRGQKSTGSRIRIWNTVFKHGYFEEGAILLTPWAGAIQSLPVCEERPAVK